MWKQQPSDICLCFRFAVSWMESASPVAKVPKTGHPCQWRWSSAPSWGMSISFTKTSLFEHWIVWEGMWRLLHIPCFLSWAEPGTAKLAKASCKCMIGPTPDLALCQLWFTSACKDCIFALMNSFWDLYVKLCRVPLHWLKNLTREKSHHFNKALGFHEA